MTAQARSSFVPAGLGRWLGVCVWYAVILLIVPFGRPLYDAGIARWGLREVGLGIRAAGFLLVAGLTGFAGRRLLLARKLQAVAACVCLAWFAWECARIHLAEELTHLLLYCPLGLLLDWALAASFPAGRVRTLLAILLTATLGALEEGSQTLMPGRFFDPTDVWLNALGGALPVLFLALTRQREEGERDRK
ncbi:MAG: VanZ family protein [Candidatus Riflebacteria bacterium]|nr:VanZ family protein [Candidatus Riflebacteria bacterium]